MSSFRLLLLSLPLFAFAGVAAAATPNAPSESAPSDTAMSDCVDLSANHEAFRFGNQALLVADGDAHYRLGFGSGCDALMASSTVDITTNGQANRLCPKGSRVSARTYSCAVREVQRISSEEYAAYQRKARTR
jgi:hypothetical protein